MGYNNTLIIIFIFLFNIILIDCVEQTDFLYFFFFYELYFKTLFIK